MFWSSEGHYFMRCTRTDVAVLSGAVALHRAWSGIMARGVALVTVEEPGMDELDAQLEQLKARGELRLGREGLEALQGVIKQTVEALQSYRRAGSSARSQGLLGMLEDCFGENVRDPKVSKEIMGQLEALSQRIGLEAS